MPFANASRWSLNLKHLSFAGQLSLLQCAMSCDIVFFIRSWFALRNASPVNGLLDKASRQTLQNYSPYSSILSYAPCRVSYLYQIFKCVFKGILKGEFVSSVTSICVYDSIISTMNIVHDIRITSSI